MYMKLMLIIAIITSSKFISASEFTGNCLLGIGETIIDKNNDGLTGCEAARIALKSDVAGDLEYRKKLYAKLANRVEIARTS